VHVVATFGAGRGQLFVNGREAASGTVGVTPLPTGALFVGGADVSSGLAPNFFTGEIGELRVYPEVWRNAPRVTDMETQLQLTNRAAPDFGQPLRVLSRNDLASADDDLVKEFRYAAPVGTSVLRAVVSSEAQRELNPDGTSGKFLTYSTTEYDRLPLGQVSAGNETRRAQFDGTAQSTQPTSLRVVTGKRYEDPSCPGHVTTVIDPSGATTTATADATCTFTVKEENALGHVSRIDYYGVTPAPTQGMNGHYGAVAQKTDVNGATTRTTYDVWGRPIAVWSALDRRDRPGVRLEYSDASCEETVLVGGANGGETVATIETSCATPLAFTLHKPARTASYSWDDQLRRCRARKNAMVPCTSPDAVSFVDETSTGAYRVSYTFSDGQVQSQVTREGIPAWTVTGISDVDAQGRVNRRYKTQYLPTQATLTADVCPTPGTWCDSGKLRGNPLRQVATVQTAYDAQGRMVRSYGPGVPRCSDPSALDATGAIACDAVAAQAPDAAVTRIEYPAPGVLRTIDAEGVPSVTYRDARGLIVRDESYMRNVAAPYAQLQYSFDPLARLTAVRDQDGNTSTSEYDTLSRIAATTDPNIGRTTYRYDLRSQVVERLVASGEKTTHIYDALGRVTQTDFLRPRTVDDVPQCCTLPDDRPPRVIPPEFCYTVPGLTEPTHFHPVHFDPHPPTLQLLRVEGLTAQLPLPFTLPLGVMGPPETGELTVKAGTVLKISTDGSVQFGDDPMKLDVFPMGLTLSENGLRYGISGAKGDQQLTIEWQGTLGARPDSPVHVRAVFAQHGAPVSLEYLLVPPDVQGGGPAMTVTDRRGGSTLGVHPLTVDGSPWVAGSGLALSLDPIAPTSGRSLRLDCSGPSGQIEWPITVPRSGDFDLQLRYRLFSPGGLLRVGYRDPHAPDVVHTLGLPGFTPRPFDSREKVTTAADRAKFALPAELRGQRITLVLGHELAQRAGGTRFELQVADLTVTRTIYEPEERVLRVYDSNEPPLFVQPRPTGGPTEAQPVIDLTFDAAGKPRDRSPTQASFSCFGPTEDTLGASGRALGLPPASSCSSSAVPTTFSQFTALFWLRPHAYPAITHTVLRLDSNFPGVAVRLQPDGKLSCGGVGGGGITTVALPTDAWSHIAVVYDGAALRCAVNGAVQGSANMTLLPRYSSLGLESADVGVDFDEVRLIPAARSDAQVLADALRPLDYGVPRGNLAHIDFSLPAALGTDHSKAQNNATLSSGQIVPGIQGMAFDANAAGQVKIAHTNALRLADQVSAELWVKTRNQQQGPARLLGKWAGAAPGWRLELANNSGRVRWEVVTNVARPGSAPQLQRAVFVTLEQINDDRWHHVGATYDAHRLRVFIDGIPAHRWCSSESQTAADVCVTPPPVEPCAVEIRTPPEMPGAKPLGDAVCINGSIDNSEPVLAARDAQQAQFRGMMDELRISNYAKREYEVAASARLASAFTQSLGRETLMRNQLPVGSALANQVAREARAYDLRGRAVTTSKYVRGQRAAGEFLTRANPDVLDRSAAIDYPHGEVVLSGYDSGGAPNSLIGYAPGLSAGPEQSQVYVERASTTVTGKPALLAYGNRVETQWTYEDGPTPAGAFAAENLHSSKVKNASGVVLSTREYEWDMLGDLMVMKDQPQSLEGTFGYDDLRRVTSATLNIGGTSSTFGYGYDALGNLTNKEGVQQDYGSANLAGICPPGTGSLPHAITRRGAVRDRYCYDAAGRLIQSSDTSGNSIRYFRYFARGKLRSLTDRNGESTYAYDGNGTRVRKVEIGATGITTDQAIPATLFRERPNGLEALYSLGAQTVARRLLSTTGSDELVWYSDDHLGGSNLLTDANGTELQSARAHYRPFGQFANGAPQTAAAGPRQFAGKELDLTGLYDFSARAYDPVTGRFAQPDEAQPGAGTQAANRYSYALNNPLVMIDPSGHEAVSAASGVRCVDCLMRDVWAQSHAEDAARVELLKKTIEEDFRRDPLGLAHMPPIKFSPQGPQMYANYAQQHGVLVFGGMADELMMQSFQAPVLAAAGTYVTGSIFVGGAVLTTLDGFSFGNALNSQDTFAISMGAAGLLMDVHGFSTKAVGLSPLEHAEWARARASQLGQELISLQNGIDWGNRTFAAGAFRDPVTGNVYNLVAANGYGGLNRGMRALQGELVIRGGGKLHAEARLLHFAAENGLQPIAIGASRAHCIMCADLNTHMGGINASPLRPFSWAKGSMIPTFGE